MASTRSLQPTLWRTCRVLANRNRLQILRLLHHQPGLTVTSVAERLKFTLPRTSQYLRALEARGLLAVRRHSRWVHYQPPAAQAGGPAVGLVAALRWTFQQRTCSTERLFKLITAFTHPRRIQVFRVLQRQARNFNQLKIATRFSERALCRHLRKLEQRGFIARQHHRYVTLAPGRTDGAMRRALAKLAAA